MSSTTYDDDPAIYDCREKAESKTTGNKKKEEKEGNLSRITHPSFGSRSLPVRVCI